jgi:hypothetical protein
MSLSSRFWDLWLEDTPYVVWSYLQVLLILAALSLTRSHLHSQAHRRVSSLPFFHLNHFLLLLLLSTSPSLLPAFHPSRLPSLSPSLLPAFHPSRLLRPTVFAQHKPSSLPSIHHGSGVSHPCLLLAVYAYKTPRLMAAIQAEGQQPSASRAHAFDSVAGLSEFAVGVLRRIGILQLYPSQKYVLQYLKVRDPRGPKFNYNKIIVAPFAAGKSMLLAFGAFVAIMACEPSPVTQTPSSSVKPAAFGVQQPLVNGAELVASHLDSPATSGGEQLSTHGIEHSTLHVECPADRPLPCKPRVLIVCPVHETAKEIGKFLDLLLTLHGHSCVILVGGDSIDADIAALRKWPTAAVGTPGRLLDHIQHNRLDLSNINYCAVDEVDTFGRNTSFRTFLDAMKDNLPECQIIAVSSRMTMEVVAPVKALLKPSSPIPTITRIGRNPQDVIRTEEVWFRLSADEFNSLPRWLNEHPAPEQYRREKSVIFVKSRKSVETFYKKYVNDLKALNIEDVDAHVRYTHGGRREPERESTLDDFRKGKFTVLFTTHMLAKGVNIPDVEVAYHIHPISDISTYREANARIGRDEKKAFICTLFGAEDEALIQTHKTAFESINGSSLVIDGETIESNKVPFVTPSEVLDALEDDGRY